MINTILWIVFADACICLLFVIWSMLDAWAYDRWQAKIDRNGIQWPVAPFEDVQYRDVTNRSNRDRTGA